MCTPPMESPAVALASFFLELPLLRTDRLKELVLHSPPMPSRDLSQGERRSMHIPSSEHFPSLAFVPGPQRTKPSPPA